MSSPFWRGDPPPTVGFNHNSAVAEAYSSTEGRRGCGGNEEAQGRYPPLLETNGDLSCFPVLGRTGAVYPMEQQREGMRGVAEGLVREAGGASTGLSHLAALGDPWSSADIAFTRGLADFFLDPTLKPVVGSLGERQGGVDSVAADPTRGCFPASSGEGSVPPHALDGAARPPSPSALARLLFHRSEAGNHRLPERETRTFDDGSLFRGGFPASFQPAPGLIGREAGDRESPSKIDLVFQQAITKQQQQHNRHPSPSGPPPSLGALSCGRRDYFEASSESLGQPGPCFGDSSVFFSNARHSGVQAAQGREPTGSLQPLLGSKPLESWGGNAFAQEAGGGPGAPGFWEEAPRSTVNHPQMQAQVQAQVGSRSALPGWLHGPASLNVGGDMSQHSTFHQETGAACGLTHSKGAIFAGKSIGEAPPGSTPSSSSSSNNLNKLQAAGRGAYDPHAGLAQSSSKGSRRDNFFSSVATVPVPSVPAPLGTTAGSATRKIVDNAGRSGQESGFKNHRSKSSKATTLRSESGDGRFQTYRVGELITIGARKLFPQALAAKEAGTLQPLSSSMHKNVSQKSGEEGSCPSSLRWLREQLVGSSSLPFDADNKLGRTSVNGRWGPQSSAKAKAGPPRRSPGQTSSIGGGASYSSGTTRYEPYISLRDALEGVSSGKYKMGVVRISKMRMEDAYISNTEDLDSPDYLIQGRQNRNRALNGDTVVFEVLDRSTWVRVQNPYIAGQFAEGPADVAQASTGMGTKAGGELGGTSSTGVPSFEGRSVVRYHPCVKVVRLLEFGGTDRPYVALLRPNNYNQSHAVAEPADQNGARPPSSNESEGNGEVLTVGPNDRFVKAVALDKRVPWILIPVIEVSQRLGSSGSGMGNGSRSLRVPADVLYRVQIANWDDNSALPIGRLLECVGNLNDFHVAERVAMTDNGLEAHLMEFSQDIEAEAQEIANQYWEALSEETAKRVDLRHQGLRILTIDPKTARDLDDAVHVRVDDSVEPSEFEIGVHIADVTHFVRNGSKLDEEARKRCTTVYLPRRNFPMLPRTLCDNLCSLTPDEDKLTFSVLFTIKSDGSLSQRRPPWFGRTVIRTTARLNYEEVQTALDAFHRFETASREAISTARAATDGEGANGVANQLVQQMSGWRPESCPLERWSNVWSDLVVLESLTQQIRKARFEKGSLKLHRAQFRADFESLFTDIAEDRASLTSLCDEDQTLNQEDGVSEHNDSAHHLIEELMLMANQLVAVKLVKSDIGGLAVLRYHKAPAPSKLLDLKALLSDLGLPSNVDTVKATFNFFSAAKQQHGELVENALECLYMKAMYAANYAVASYCPDPHHFALNMPLYTHFTSPIRRYADVMVHRLLSNVLLLERNPSLLAKALGPAALALPAPQPGTEESPESAAFLAQQQKEIRARAALTALRTLGHDIDEEKLIEQCNQCNEKRLQARCASEECSVFFFCTVLHDSNRVVPTLGAVLGCQDAALQLYIGQLGTCRRLYYNNSHKGCSTLADAKGRNAANAQGGGLSENGKRGNTAGSSESTTNNLQKIPPQILKTLVLPLSITARGKYAVEIVWPGPLESVTGTEADHVQGKKPEAQGALGSAPASTNVRYTQLTRIMGPLPVYLVPLSTTPRDFGVIPIPPWNPDFSRCLTQSPLLTAAQREELKAACASGLQKRYVDLGGVEVPGSELSGHDDNQLAAGGGPLSSKDKDEETDHKVSAKEGDAATLRTTTVGETEKVSSRNTGEASVEASLPVYGGGKKKKCTDGTQRKEGQKAPATRNNRGESHQGPGTAAPSAAREKRIEGVEATARIIEFHTTQKGSTNAASASSKRWHVHGKGKR